MFPRGFTFLHFMVHHNIRSGQIIFFLIDDHWFVSHHFASILFLFCPAVFTSLRCHLHHCLQEFLRSSMGLTYTMYFSPNFSLVGICV